MKRHKQSTISRNTLQKKINDVSKKLTLQQARYHGAHAACQDANNKHTPAAKPAHKLTVNKGAAMYYCWSHRLGINPNYTGQTCKNRKDGHKEEATATNMMSGCNIIMESRRCLDK